MDNDEAGARLTRQEENRELIAKHRATVEPRGCPTPGACSAVEEIADLKQRLLPQYLGRAERAEMIVSGLRQQLDSALFDLQASESRLKTATGATDAEVDEFVRVARTFSDEHFQNSLVAELRRVYHALALQDAPVDHSYNRSASISEGRYVCTCAAGRVMHEKTCALKRPQPQTEQP